MAAYPNILFVFLSLTLPTLCFCGFSVELIHRDSPKSPFYNPIETPFQQLNNAFHRSFSRVNHFYPKSKASQKTPQSVITSNQGEYLVKYSIGTPPFEVMGIADTGSDLIWSQCKPCDQCYNQTTPLFDPSKSSTYEPVSCYSRVCQLLGKTYCYSANGDPNCEYTVSYGDGSHSQGTLAFDTFTLDSTTGSSVAFTKISIGCGVNNAGTFDSKGSGIVGLGGGVVSLISQIGPSIDFKFSYCLVPLFESKSISKLNFGENAVVAGPGTVSTPIIPGPVDTFYYLKLEGMSVGSKRIEFICDSTSNVANGNIIIDSGTTLTILPEKFYTKLELEVAAHINLERVNSTDQILSLCYQSPPNNAIETPIITAHFSGADVVLNSLNTFISVSNYVTCFAFAPMATNSIFGNLAQMNYLVGYDLQRKTVSFKPTDCTKIGKLESEALKGGFSVQLIHRDSSKSPLYNPSESAFQQLKSAFQRSFNRVNHFYPKSKVSRKTKTPQSVITWNHGEYLVKYSIGTPPFEVMGVFDTGSDLIWSQCKPCKECYNQTNPLFDYSKSSTYEPIHCKSRVCKSLGEANCYSHSDPTCEYTVIYGDGSHSRGFLAFDTLTLPSTTDSSIAFPKIFFGCGVNNGGIFDPKASGIVGVGGGAVSLISQIGPSIDFKFSYCLVPLFSESESTSKLNFGENAVVAGPGTVSTPIIPGPVNTFYYLKLKGMSVGSKRIELISDSKSNNGKGNIIIDSGTTLTFLPQKLYTKLESEVAAQIKLERVHSPEHVLSLCYKSPSNNAIEAPIITAHFSGADVVLNSLNTFVSVSDNVTCFAFAPVMRSDSIFGNIAQMNHLVGYDLQKKTVSFKPTDCSKM
ncbi:Aspartic proteinase CDR1, partial [Mucuna pruriens]